MILQDFKFIEENCTCSVDFRLNALPFYEEFYHLYRSTFGVLFLRKDIPLCNGSFKRLWKRTKIKNSELNSTNYREIAQRAFHCKGVFKETY